MKTLINRLKAFFKKSFLMTITIVDSNGTIIETRTEYVTDVVLLNRNLWYYNENGKQFVISLNNIYDLTITAY